MPLLEGTDGVQKMSKSFGNYIGITESPKEMFGKIMSISDTLMWRYYELLTDLSLNELARMKKECDENKLNPKDAKVRLAKEIVTTYHSKDAAGKAEKEFENIFKKGGLPEDTPVYKIEKSQLKDGAIWVCNLLTQAGLTDSNSDARRLIKQGAVSIDGEKISDENAQVEVKEGMILKVGKRRILKIEIKPHP